MDGKHLTTRYAVQIVKAYSPDHVALEWRDSLRSPQDGFGSFEDALSFARQRASDGHGARIVEVRHTEVWTNQEET